MKKIAVKRPAILLLISALFLNVNTAFALSADGYIKVGLSYGGGAVSSCTVSCGDGLAIAEAGSSGFEEIMSLPDCRQMSISFESGRVIAKDESGAVAYDDFDADTCIIPFNSAGGEVLKYNGKPFRGGICFYPQAGGRMNVINYIGLDEYLYGVLNSEMGHSNPMEALKAQAVTARSFAVSNKGKHAGEGFDLCPEAHCQIYNGYSDEYDETNRAIDETSGLTLTYGGEPVSGYYFKNSGGHTQSASSVWGAGAPYLTGVKDEYSPEYTWNYTITFQEARAKLDAAGYDTGELRSVAITGRDTSGAVSAVEFTGTRGTAELKNDKIRTVFGSGNIKSMIFSFGSGAVNEPARYDDTLYIIGAGGAVEKLDRGDVYILSGGATSKMVDLEPAPEEKAELTTEGPLVFYGTGFGHGVGMPQDSAIEMAKLGFKYDEILNYFFTGIEIQ